MPSPLADTDWMAMGTMLATLIASLTAAAVAVIGALAAAARQKALTKIMMDSAAVAQADAQRAAAGVAQVKTDLAASDKRTIEADRVKNEKLDVIHALVNSGMAAQLQLTAVAARALAEQTQDPEALLAANAAERLLREHQIKQNNADAGTDPAPGVKGES